MRTLLLPALLLASAATAAPAPHSRFLTLDTHLDTGMSFARPGWDFATRHNYANDIAQLDIPRMQDGALDGGFFAIYTEQGPLTAQGYADALAFARGRSDLIDRTIAANGKAIAPALTAADARRLDKAGKLIAFKSMENSLSAGRRPVVAGGVPPPRRAAGQPGALGQQPVRRFRHRYGEMGRLGPLGKQWVKEMNRLGIAIDASHASDAAFDQMLALSTRPILLSHSSLRSTFDHPRNLDEVRLKQLAAKGGAMCISTIFMSTMNMTPARAEVFGQYEHSDKLTPAEQVEMVRKWRALDKTEPMWAADFEAYMTMVLRAIKVAGVDHICFGADWDGGGGLAGYEDISALPKVTERLRAAGYSDTDLAKMWGGNVLRIVSAAQN